MYIIEQFCFSLNLSDNFCLNSLQEFYFALDFINFIPILFFNCSPFSIHLSTPELLFSIVQLKSLKLIVFLYLQSPLLIAEYYRVHVLLLSVQFNLVHTVIILHISFFVNFASAAEILSLTNDSVTMFSTCFFYY